MDKSTLKLIGVVGAIILIGNIFLFAFRIITPLIFWIVIVVMALLVYVGLPRMKK